MKTLAVLIASLSLTGCIATVGVTVPVYPVYGYQHPVYVQPAPAIIVVPSHNHYHHR